MSKTQISGTNKQIKNDNLEEHTISSNHKTTITLEPGKNVTTMTPGKVYPIMFKEILAGEYIKEWNITNLTRLLTPLVPTLDRVYLNVQAYFVPNTRIWKDAEATHAGKDYGSYIDLPKMKLLAKNMKHATFNRNIISKYGIPNRANDTNINLLLPRGYRAIENDYIRNKDYIDAKIEWNETTPTTAEKNNIIGYTEGTKNFISGVTKSTVYELANAPARKGYLTNIKKHMILETGESIDEDGGTGNQWPQHQHLDWQTRFQDLKQRAENRNKNDWDIIAEMGGTQPVTTDRVQFLGEIDYQLNYQQITQSAPEINDSSPLGTTGSFSFTQANGTLFQHKKFLQHGFIHILANVNIDNYFENGTPKELLKTTIDEIYRPGLDKIETQLLKKQEIRNIQGSSGGAAYQPAWSEYKRLPSFASGQMQTTMLLKITDVNDYEPVSNSQWHNMKSDITAPVINEKYFNDYENVIKVFARNNILNLGYTENDLHFKVDPIMNMSEHIVKTQLPIESGTLKGNQKAEITR